MKHIAPSLVLLFAVVSCDGRSPTDPFSRRGATLSGVVVDRYGNVWVGVTIGIVDPEAGAVDSGVTGDDGRDSISRLRPGRYRVWLQLGRTGPGYFAADIDLREGDNELDLVTR